MSVASHLKIDLAQYDRMIRTFIPGYTKLLNIVASAVDVAASPRPVIVDLGIGTGALAARCLARRPAARLHGIDADAEILGVARRRLGRRWPGRVTLEAGDFSRSPLPSCDTIVATLALHHIRSRAAKGLFYRKCWKALRRGGLLASGDCFPSRDPVLAGREMSRWRAHMRRTYDARATRGYLAAWAAEDLYLPLADEWALLERAGFRVEVLWREPPFGVLLGRKP